ncbi:hypothetical protein ONZ51_g6946 [Trametes cubensis]|uniref:Uncharacterized protein n=1 Tax=Trametes cubensis TaxID=1111947 RepID=A0AAD7TS95_9APHY|nr:hypothetical protein ONZ51_g6946 [Trametes cubensis]
MPVLNTAAVRCSQLLAMRSHNVEHARSYGLETTLLKISDLSLLVMNCGCKSSILPIEVSYGPTLGTIPNNEGHIRLSLDEGPSAREFLDDDYDDDNERVGEDEPLAVTAGRLRKAVDSADSELQQSTLVFAADADEPPPPPPKA